MHRALGVWLKVQCVFTLFLCHLPPVFNQPLRLSHSFQYRIKNISSFLFQTALGFSSPIIEYYSTPYPIFFANQSKSILLSYPLSFTFIINKEKLCYPFVKNSLSWRRFLCWQAKPLPARSPLKSKAVLLWAVR